MLLLFLKVYALLRQNGIFILEYQPWSSYHKKCHYSPTLAKNYAKLQLRPEHFPFILQKLGMQLLSKRKPSQVEELKQSTVKGFNREVAIFRKTGEDLPFDIREVSLDNVMSFIRLEDFLFQEVSEVSGQ